MKMPQPYVKNRRRFRTIQTASALDLPFPVNPKMRLAQISDVAPTFGNLRPLLPESSADLQGFRPNMIVGLSADLQHLAVQVSRGLIDLSSVDHAVIALTRCGMAPLTDVARVVLWQTFGVPVFEIFTGFDHFILAYECELHEGWHLAPHVSLAECAGELMLQAPGVVGLHTALTGFITMDRCPCGRKSPRLMDVQPFQACDLKSLPWAAIA
jgi:hypothetical protein